MRDARIESHHGCASPWPSSSVAMFSTEHTTAPTDVEKSLGGNGFQLNIATTAARLNTMPSREIVKSSWSGVS